MFCLPVGNNSSTSSIFQNKTLHNVTLIVGSILIALGITLSCLGHPAAYAGGSVALSLGTPILLFGIFMTIYRIYALNKGKKEPKAPVRTKGWFDWCRGKRVGGGHVNPQTQRSTLAQAAEKRQKQD